MSTITETLHRALFEKDNGPKDPLAEFKKAIFGCPNAISDSECRPGNCQNCPDNPHCHPVSKIVQK